MSTREVGQSNKQYPHALPAFSVDTSEEAEAIIVRFGQMRYDGSYRMTGWNTETAGLDDVYEVGERFADFYQVLKGGKT